MDYIQRRYSEGSDTETFAVSADLTKNSVSIAVPITNPSLAVHSDSLTSTSSLKLSIGSASSGEVDIQYIKASEVFPKKSPWQEDSISPVSPPFPLLPGEFVVLQGKTVEGPLHVSNYRMYLSRTTINENSGGSVASTPECKDTNKDVNIPLGLFELVECKDIFYLNIFCKDSRSFRLVFSSGESCQEWGKRLTLSINFARRLEDVFGLAFYAWSRDLEEPNGTSKINRALPTTWWEKPSLTHQPPLCGEALFRSELKRQGYDMKGAWRITTANADFKLCPSYPSLLLVPACISDDNLVAVAAFRGARRLPAIVWRHRTNGAVIARCSQPEVGWLGWRSQEDENLLRAILDACYYDSGSVRESSPDFRADPSSPEWGKNGFNGDNGVTNHVTEYGSLKDLSEDSSCFTKGKKKMLIVDARSYPSAVANRARGGGCETPQYYPHCEIEFMNLANIHTVRKSFQALRSICFTAATTIVSVDQSNWFTQLDSTRWLHHLANLIRAACLTAAAVHIQGRPVLVHCSDGWDRTPQIVSLAELLVDPFYRTIEGFQVLVQREWLEFGHKFADRCGLYGGCEDLNERCPAFLQFLDCVHQLMHQFPTAFQFNSSYLVKLVQHVYSNLFGTFLCNTVQERQAQRVYERTFQVWTFLNAKNPNLFNYVYDYTEEPLWPSYQVRDMKFWSKVYLADLGTSGCQLDGCHGNQTLSSSNSPCSSGYATPQQTGLTDSMVDSLAWRNNSAARTVMEDSTDTLVDDSGKNTDGDELDHGESFPLLEPYEPTQRTVKTTDKKNLNLPLVRNSQKPPENAGKGKTDLLLELNRNSTDECETCQQVLDLLAQNRGPAGNDVPSNASAKSSPLRIEGKREEGFVRTCLNFDSDGLPPSLDLVQSRVRQILAAKEAELESLRQDLHRTRVALCRQVCHKCNAAQNRDGNKTQNFYPLSPTLPQVTAIEGSGCTGSSASSWENVDEKELDEKGGGSVAAPTLWVPDHAAPMCMGCSTPFWLGRRRHHCRNCGQVFCADCAGHELPLPLQHLVHPVRVCNNCYEELKTRNEHSSELVGKLRDEARPLQLPTVDPRAASDKSGAAAPESAVLKIHRRNSAANGTCLGSHCSCKSCDSERSSGKFKTVTAASN